MAAALNCGKNFRSWKTDDSLDISDVERLFEGEKVKITKSVNCFQYWLVYCTLVGFFSLFFIGILVGFFLKADPTVAERCRRDDGFDRDKLQAIHNNIIYLMSSGNIQTYARELSSLELQSLNNSDRDGRVTALYIKDKFEEFGFDKVAVEEHNIEVTSPDPLNPNRLRVVSPDGSTVRDEIFSSNINGDNFPEGFVEFSPRGHAEGPLVYGHYGREVDFLQLQSGEVLLQGSLILLRLGYNDVARKVKLAQKHGCVGMLLYCHQGDHCYHDKHDLLVAMDFKEIEGGGELPSIPLQSVSHALAMDLISQISRASLPSTWQQLDWGQQFDNRTADVTPSVSLEVNNRRTSEIIYNIVATLFGGHESDHQVVVGSKYGSDRLHRHDIDIDSLYNTGTLLELGRSMAYINSQEQWKPRRTVQFVSFGGHVPGVGLFHYLKSYRHILSQEAVAYIDLDTQNKQSKVIEYRSSASLMNVIWRTADMIPEPSNPEYSLVERWPKLSYDRFLSNESWVNMYRLGEPPLTQNLGIPSISMYSLLVRDHVANQGRGDVIDLSYLLASARVVSLSTLKLLDDFTIPVNISFLIHYANKAVFNSLGVLKEHVPDVDDKIGQIVDISRTLSQLSAKLQLSPFDCSKRRKINSILMRFESIFQTGSSEKCLFFLQEQTGILSEFIDVRDKYLITKNRDIVIQFLDQIHQVLNEATQEVRTLNKR